MAISIDSLPENIRRRVLEQIGFAAAAPKPSTALAATPTPKRTRKANAHPRGKRCQEDGFTFDSETERRVYRRLRDEIAASSEPELRLFHKPRFNLWNLEPHPNGRPRTITPDFAIVRGLATVVRVVDAKPREKRARSRDWARGKAALDACLAPVRIEELAQ